MKHVLALLLGFFFAVPAWAEDKKVVDIYMQSKDDKYSTKFYMWVDSGGDVIVENSAPRVRFGYSIDCGKAYIYSNECHNLMFFVHPYDEKNKHCLGYCTSVWFGGNRDDDIHIYLPKGYTHTIHVSKIKYSEPKPEEPKPDDGD